MARLVLELQQAAMDAKTPVGELLRQAKVVAVKLDLDNALTWIDSELKGYTGGELPLYRHVQTQIKALNPYYGWQPVSFGNSELRAVFSNQYVFEGVPKIEDLLKRVETGGTIGNTLPAEAEQFIYKQMPVKLQLQRQIDGSSFVGILEAVRAKILEWSLELEKQGILGEGMTFSKEEKEKASAGHTTINIGSIGNLAGSVGGSIEHQNIHANQTGNGDFVTRVKEFSKATRELAKEFSSAETADLHKTLDEIDQESQKPKPNETFIKKSLRKLTAYAVELPKFAAQALINAEVGKLLGGQ